MSLSERSVGKLFTFRCRVVMYFSNEHSDLRHSTPAAPRYRNTNSYLETKSQKVASFAANSWNLT